MCLWEYKMAMGFWESMTKPMIQWDTKPKVINNYITTNNYYIHTENKVIQVTEEEFKKFIKINNLKMIKHG